MTNLEIERMWDIDNKAQLGDFISEEEKEFFNENYERMLNEMKDNLSHWENHTNKI